MKYYILFGPPGAGKGTQASILVKKFNLCHISTGELLRAEIASGSDLGKQVDVIISQGNFVPDSMVEQMLAKRIQELGKSTDGTAVTGLILDGFPRTISQAMDLDNLLAKKGGKIDAAIFLSIPDRVIAARIAHRANVENRADDAQESTILNRIKTYHEQTEPLVQYYKKTGCFYDVDGNKSIEEVGDTICNLMSNL